MDVLWRSRSAATGHRDDPFGSSLRGTPSRNGSVFEAFMYMTTAPLRVNVMSLNNRVEDGSNDFFLRDVYSETRRNP